MYGSKKRTAHRPTVNEIGNPTAKTFSCGAILDIMPKPMLTTNNVTMIGREIERATEKIFAPICVMDFEIPTRSAPAPTGMC